MAIYAYSAMRRSGLAHPNTLALHWTIGSAVFTLFGAGLLGLAHTFPDVNKWTHGTLITAMHGHAAFYGAYGMIVLAMITFALPAMTPGRSERGSAIGYWSFWMQLGGMFGMTLSFATAGIAQVYLERILGMGYLDAQLKIQVHFVMLLATGVALLGRRRPVHLRLLPLRASLRGRATRRRRRCGRVRRRPGAGAVSTPTSRGDLRAVDTHAQPSAPTGAEPYYLPSGDEVAIFQHCHARRLAVMLKGPTGCGKTRFVEHMAWRLGRPLVTISCHDDLTASDLVGRFLIRHDGTAWQDGPLTRAVREGAICYLDEIVEARQDTVVVLHPLADHRRILPIDKTGETIEAAPGFQLVVSYNPGYQRMLKDLKPSTRQRFVALDFDFPPADHEAAIIEREGAADHATARALVSLAHRLRGLRDRGLAEVPSTRLLIAAARLIASGISVRQACYSAVVSPLSDDESLVGAMRDLVDATFV